MPTSRPNVCRKAIHVNGVVQGVGFRPFVYGLATRYGLVGWVRNTSAGVDIEIEGPPEMVAAFERDLTAKAPPLAVVESVTSHEVPPNGEGTFEILHSEATGGISLISPDVAVCPDCLRELFDPGDRRYRYPFINCTNCGPRFTIIKALPYDRPQTTMRPFEMCPRCRAEYDDPADRRFHAQPNACPVCGPHVWLEGPVAAGEERDDAMRRAAELLGEGAILAIKGLGGFHLACDATNPDAVARLRERKGRPHKPFAVMMDSLETVRRHCVVSQAEARLLQSPSAPIVLLRKRPESDVTAGVAPGNLYLGVMLPYTPLHHILLRDVGRPLVMTSGNHTDEPISCSNEAALSDLGDIADGWLLHDREIYMRCDDSVMAVADESPYPIRRSRGYAPFPVPLSNVKPVGDVLATGTQMKNTFCLLIGSRAFLSQHIGELDNLETLAYFEQAVSHFISVFRASPRVLAYDLHPGYLSSRWAKGEISVKYPVGELLPTIEHKVGVQHHHAHIAACLADNGADGPVIGLAWDGTGYGPDGAIWGGEAMIAGFEGYERVAHLEYAPLPGGEVAIRRPIRLAFGYLTHILGEVPDLPALRALGDAERAVISRQIERGINTPLTSSMGRLFDVVSAMLGLCAETTFEAQAAIALEMAATDVPPENRYPVMLDSGQVLLGPLLAAIADDVGKGMEPARAASAFHAWAAKLALRMAEIGRERDGLNRVALSGGVWQNRLLLDLALQRLTDAGFGVLVHRRVPTNDGGVSLGQAAIAARKIGLGKTG